MVATRRRAMGLLVLCLVLLGGGIYAYQSEQSSSAAALGEMVTVVAASRPLDAWTPIQRTDLQVRSVPRRFVGSDLVTSAEGLVGRVLTTAIPEGAAIPSYLLYSGVALQPGQRTWDLRQNGNVVLDSHLQPGDAVDVLAAGGKPGQETVQQLLSGTRVVAVLQKDKEFIVTLAVSLDEGKALMNAENFARQVRVIRNPMAAEAGGQP